jgi:hypothetical protein
MQRLIEYRPVLDLAGMLELVIAHEREREVNGDLVRFRRLSQHPESQ